MPFSMPTQLGKFFDQVSILFSRTILLENVNWRLGVAVGATTGALINVLMNWRFKLSFTINLIGLVDRIVFSFLSPPYHIAENDLHRINLFRKFFTIMPNCSAKKMKSIHDIKIPSPEGHVIPATVYTPLSQVSSEVKRPIIIHMYVPPSLH